MANRYFFDKRDIKHFIIKYGIILLIAMPILLGINILFKIWFNVDNMVFLDLVFLSVIVVIAEAICFKLKQRRERKENTKEK